MSNKITVKRTRKYVRFFCGGEEVHKIMNLYEAGCPEYTDEALIRYCLVPWLKEALSKEQRDRKETIAKISSLNVCIDIHEKALMAGIMI